MKMTQDKKTTSLLNGYERVKHLVKDNETLYKSIIKDFYKLIGKEILLEGKKFDLGFGLKTIQIIMAVRTKPRIDFYTTMKMRKEGVLEDKEHYYYEENTFPLFYWDKKDMKIKNSRNWIFVPCRSIDSVFMQLRKNFREKESYASYFEIKLRYGKSVYKKSLEKYKNNDIS